MKDRQRVTDDDHKEMTLRRALRSAEFWLLLVIALAVCFGVAWWVAVPVAAIAGLSISSLPKYIELWPRVRMCFALLIQPTMSKATAQHDQKGLSNRSARTTLAPYCSSLLAECEGLGMDVEFVRLQGRGGETVIASNLERLLGRCT